MRAKILCNPNTFFVNKEKMLTETIDGCKAPLKPIYTKNNDNYNSGNLPMQPQFIQETSEYD